MLDSHTSHFVIVSNFLFVGKIAHHFSELCAGNVFIRRGMVGHKRNLFGIKYVFDAEFMKSANSKRRCDVISKNKINRTINQLTRLHTIDTSMSRQELFRHRHRLCRHVPSPS